MNFWRNWKNKYFEYFLESLDTHNAELIENVLVESKEPLIVYSKYYGCWYPVAARSRENIIRNSIT